MSYGSKLFFVIFQKTRHLHKFDHAFFVHYQTLSPHQVSYVGLFRLVRFCELNQKKKKKKEKYMEDEQFKKDDDI